MLRWINPSISFYVLLSFTQEAFSYDSLQTALSLHQASQFQKHCPFLSSFQKKFSNGNDIANYSLCQLKIAGIIRNYGGVNLSIEMLNNNESYLILLRLFLKKCCSKIQLIE